MSKNRKQRVKRSRWWQVAQCPEDLPAQAEFAWPDLRALPTLNDVQSFRLIGHDRPDIHLAVLNGLRRFAESSSQLMLGLAAFIVSLSALALAIYGSSTPGFRLAATVTGVLLLLTLGTYVQAAVDLEERRKAAIVWLRALEHKPEDPLPRKGFWRRSPHA